MSIVDKELDDSCPGPVGVNAFANTWLNRGGCRPKVKAAMRAVGMTLTPEPVVDQQPSPNDIFVRAYN